MFSGSITISLYLSASLIGFATGTAISILLLVLTVRGAKLQGASAAGFLFVTCCLIWNLGGLAHSVALTCGAPEQGRAALIILACQYTAASLQALAVIQVQDGIVRATTAKDSFWVNYQLAELEAALPPHEFFRARREVLVNVSQIKEIKPYFKSSFLLIMSDAASTEIAVSERQARPLRQRLPGL
jgi:LytTr DNA-binding domain